MGTRRFLPATFGALMLALAACSDSAVAPESAAARVDDLAPVPPPSAAKAAGRIRPGDTTRATIVVMPQVDGVYSIGRHWVYFPARSICDPALSTYGTTEWDKPCTPSALPITITAKTWVDNSGRPYVDFGQHLRFVPTETVILHMQYELPKGKPTDTPVSIDWFNDKQRNVDESRTDFSLSTRRGHTGLYFRRIKHFSGYNVALGFYGGGSTDQELGLDGASSVGGRVAGSVVATEKQVWATTLQRRTPLARDITVSSVIGKSGGVLEIREAGLRLFVPPGAVDGPVDFTATALKGSMIAYEFGPHGTTFNKPLTFRQDLKPTTWFHHKSGVQLELGYFKDKSQIDAPRGRVLIDEFLPAVEVKQSRIQFDIHHFSGYVLASGRKSSY